MKRSSIRFLAAGACLLAGCATRGDMDSALRDLEEMKGRLLTVEKEVGGVKTETKEGLEKSLDLDLDDVLEWEAAHQSIMLQTEEHQEAVRRFKARRQK